MHLPFAIPSPRVDIFPNYQAVKYDYDKEASRQLSQYENSYCIGMRSYSIILSASRVHESSSDRSPPRYKVDASLRRIDNS